MSQINISKNNVHINAKNIWKKILNDYNHWISFVFLMIIAVIVNPGFLTWSNITNQFVQGAIIGIVALGMTMVITAGMIDLSVGSTAAIVSGIGVVILNDTHNIWLTLLFCLGFGTVLGLINGILVAYGKIAPFIVTLATMSAYRSIITQMGQSGPFTVDSTMYEPFREIAAGQTLGIPNLMLIFIITAIIISILMNHTKFGRYVYAIGSNEQAARLTGINVEAMKAGIYTITGLLTGFTAFLLAARLTAIQAASAGSGYELDAIAAVAIGGTSMEGGRGKVIGTVLGILMLRVINTILIMANVPPFLNGLVRGIIIIIAVLTQLKRKNK